MVVVMLANSRREIGKANIQMRLENLCDIHASDAMAFDDVAHSAAAVNKWTSSGSNNPISAGDEWIGCRLNVSYPPYEAVAGFGGCGEGHFLTVDVGV